MERNLESKADASYSFAKAKIGADLSYPLKRSLLDDALRSTSAYDAVCSVVYVSTRYGNMVLEARFIPEGFGAHPTVSGRNEIVLRPVPREQRHNIEQILVNHALPVLCDWLVKTRNEGNAWRGMRHSITFELAGGTIRYAEG
jgi:hypothetical protein